MCFYSDAEVHGMLGPVLNVTNYHISVHHCMYFSLNFKIMALLIVIHISHNPQISIGSVT